MLVDEPQRLAFEQVSGVEALVLLGRGVAQIHRRHTVALVRPVVDAGVDESVEVVKSPLQRQIALEGAEVPFAKHSGGVPSLGEHL